jgi:SAM-dependent methyltransferase
MKSTLYEDAEEYDKIANYKEDIKLWRNLTKGKDGILELCCGTGRIIESLLPYHKDITGIDNSKKMLVVTEAKTKAFRNKVKLYKRNITRFNLKRTFNSILLVNTSFGCLLTKSDVFKFQACLKKHMTSDTEFILETTPKNIRKVFKFNVLTPIANFTDDADGKTIEVYHKAENTSNEKVVKREMLYYKENKLLGKKSLFVSIFEPSEIKNMFTKNGFYFTREYGGYNSEPYNSSSQKYISVIKKNNLFA